jgi:hypothetical protein
VEFGVKLSVLLFGAVDLQALCADVAMNLEHSMLGVLEFHQPAKAFTTAKVDP